MKIQRLLSALIGAVWVMLAVSIVFVAVYVALTRAIFKVIPDLQEDIQIWLSEKSGLVVKIDDIDSEWNLLHPRIILRGLSVYDSKAIAKITTVDSAELHIDLPKSFENLVPVLDLAITTGELYLHNAQGQLSFPGQLPNSDERSLAFAAQWLQRDKLEKLVSIPFNLVIENYQLILLSESGSSHHFSLHSHIQRKNNQLRGQGKLQSLNEGDIAFALDMSVGRGVTEDWNGKAWIGAQQFPFYGWIPQLGQWNLEQGQLEGQLWFELDAGKVERVQGAIDLNGTEGAPLAGQDEGNVALNNLSFNLRYVNETYRDNRMLDIYDLDVESEVGSWLDRRLRISQFSDQLFKYQEVQLDSLDLQVFSDLLLRFNPLPTNFQKLVSSLKPQGEVSEVVVRVKKAIHAQPSEPWIPDFVHLRGSNLGWDAYERIPAVRGLSGWVNSNQEGALASVKISNGLVKIDSLYKHALENIDIDGLIRMRRFDTGWVIDSNRIRARLPELELGFDLGLSSFGGAPVGLSVHSKLYGSRVNHIDHVLPSNVLSTGLTDWLGYALKEGDLVAGDLLWEGVPAKSTRTEHTLGLRFELANLLLDYFKGWPALHEASGDVDIVNGDTYISIERAAVGGAKLLPSTARIIVSQGKPASLELVGSATATVKQLQDFLASSPLASKIPQAVLALDVAADATVDLDLAIPLSEGGRRQYKVGLAVENGNLSYEPIKLKLSAMKGRVEYDLENGVSIPALSANFFGHAIEINALSQRDTNVVTQTTLNATGRIPINTLFAWQQWNALPGLSGSAPLAIRIVFPWSKNPIEMFVESELSGVEITLPEPFTKQAKDLVLFKTHMEISPDRSSAELMYGKHMKGLFQWSKDYPVAGHVVWGKTPPQVVLGRKEPSLVFELNQVALDVKPWIDFFSADRVPNVATNAAENVAAELAPPPPHQSAEAGAAHSVLPVILQLSESDLTLGKYQLKKVRATYKRLKSINLVSIDSDDMKGTIEWPLQKNNGRLNIDLNLFRYPLNYSIADQVAIEDATAASSAAAEIPEPSNADLLGEWGGVHIVIDKLFMHGEDWGEWEVVAANYPQRLVFESVKSHSQQLKLNASGEWLKNQGGVSILEGRAAIGNADTLFRGVGQEALLSSKQGSTNFNLSWPGAPQDFHPTRLSGRAKLKLEEGRLNVSGRGTVLASLFGLLNLKGLFKLLKLDFSDITDEGLGFDSLDGEYLINKQLLTIVSVALRGNTIGMDLSGTIDFTSRKLNQQMDVTIPLSDGLIIPAALTGSLPILATVFVVDRAFGSTINKLTRTTFSITGTIENPKFKLKGVPEQ